MIQLIFLCYESIALLDRLLSPAKLQQCLWATVTETGIGAERTIHCKVFCLTISETGIGAERTLNIFTRTLTSACITIDYTGYLFLV